MSLQVRAPRRRRAAVARPDNRLDFFDQASFLSLRATGRVQAMQGVWVYEHPIDMAGVRRFHRAFGQGMPGRLIEPSPLPFGRHRWVSALGPPSELDIAAHARPRAELSDWLDERSQLPVDPENGPGWHLGVQAFTDGSTAVCLTGSHCLTDGVGALLSIADGISGTIRDFGYPPPRSRTRRAAMLTDVAHTVRAVPEVARTLAATVKLVTRRRHDLARAGAPRPAAATGTGADDGGRNVVVPTVTVFVGTEEWDACAQSGGGTSYALLAAIAAKLGERMGRRRAEDGAVAMLVAVSDRTADDTRAHAMRIGNATVDPTSVDTDLSGVRAALRQAIQTVRDEPDEALQILPLIPFIPKPLMKRLADVFIGTADLPVSCSNFGDLHPVIADLDGTPAEYVFQRGVDQNVTRGDLERDQGQLVVVSGRINGKISIAVVGYQPGVATSKPALRALVLETLASFGLTGTVL